MSSREREVIVLDDDDDDDADNGPIEVDEDEEVEFIGTSRTATSSSRSRPTGVVVDDDDSQDSVQLVSSPVVKTSDPKRSTPKKRKRGGKVEAAPAMRQGAKVAACLNDVDAPFDLSAKQRTAVLEALFDVEGKKGKLNVWRVQAEKTGSTTATTLWALASSALAEFEPRVHGASSVVVVVDVDDEGEGEEPVLPAELSTRTGESCRTASVLDYLHRRLVALKAKPAFDAAVDSIEEQGNEERRDSELSLKCPVCLEDFAMESTVCCNAADSLHAVCKPCFRQLCVQVASGKGSGPSSVSCPVPGCESVFAAQDVRSCVSVFDLMTMEERERETSLRTALGSTAALLRCVCGVVGAVSEADIGDGVVHCPGAGCRKSYCTKCGGAAHPKGENCPPPSDMIKWLEKKTKKCPKCKEAIEKSSGCNHMTCRCGSQFCWLCLGPYPNCNCGHFEDESRRAAELMRRQDLAQMTRQNHHHHRHHQHHHMGNHYNNHRQGGGGVFDGIFNFGQQRGGHAAHLYDDEDDEDDEDDIYGGRGYGNRPTYNANANRRRSPRRRPAFHGQGRRLSDY